MSNIFRQHDHRPPTESKDRCRPRLKGKLKSHANALHGTSVSAVLVSAKLHCFQKCLLAQCWNRGCKSWIPFFWCMKSQDKTKETHTLIGFSLVALKCYLYLALWLNHSGDGNIVVEKAPVINCIWQVIKLSVEVSAFAHIAESKRSGCELILTISDLNNNFSMLFSVKWEFDFSPVHENPLWKTNGRL